MDDTYTVTAVILWGAVLIIARLLRFLINFIKKIPEDQISQQTMTCISIDVLMRGITFALMPLGATIAGAVLPVRLRELIATIVTPKDALLACIVALSTLLICMGPLKDMWKNGLQDKVLAIFRGPVDK